MKRTGDLQITRKLSPNVGTIKSILKTASQITNYAPYKRLVTKWKADVLERTTVSWKEMKKPCRTVMWCRRLKNVKEWSVRPATSSSSRGRSIQKSRAERTDWCSSADSDWCCFPHKPWCECALLLAGQLEWQSAVLHTSADCKHLQAVQHTVASVVAIDIRQLDRDIECSAKPFPVTDCTSDTAEELPSDPFQSVVLDDDSEWGRPDDGDEMTSFLLSVRWRCLRRLPDNVG